MSAFIASRPANISAARAAGLPSYATELAAFHRGFAPELQQAIDLLPLTPEMRVIDVGCGDGFYLPLLARKLNFHGAVIGLDRSAPFLNLARHNVDLCAARCRVDLIAGSFSDIPEHCRACDLVWCAQCLYTLPEPAEALRQMARILKPGGILAVLENDTLHQLILPWSPRLEIALRAAEYRALEQDAADPEKYYVGRHLPALFREAGLKLLGLRTQAINRHAPMDWDLTMFLRSYLERLARRVRPYLEREVWEEFERQIDPSSSSDLLHQPDFAMTWINILAWGQTDAKGPNSTSGS